MCVDVVIHMFGLPDIAIEDYTPPSEQNRELAAPDSQPFGAIAGVAAKLHNDGWGVKLIRNNLEARHPAVSSHAEAVARLNQLHIEGDPRLDYTVWSNEGKRLLPP
jgi:hypothetical protein